MITPSQTRQPVTFGVSPSEYHKRTKQRGDKAFTMSYSEIKRFSENAWKWIQGAEDDESDSLDWGNLIDCLVLTPDEFETRYAITPETYPAEKSEEKPWNWNAKYCKEWRSEREAKGITCIKPATASEAQLAKARLISDPIINELVETSHKQVQLCADWTDEDTGLVIPIQCLLDLVPSFFGSHSDFLMDLKTTVDASERAWDSQVWKFRYHIQAALYIDVWNACKPDEPREHFAHIIQENSAPYAKARRMLPDEYIQTGRDDYREILRKYCRCLEQDYWPDYDDEHGDGMPIVNGFRLVKTPTWALPSL